MSQLHHNLPPPWTQQEVFQALSGSHSAAGSIGQAAEGASPAAVAAAGELLKRLEGEVEEMRGRNSALAEDVFRLTSAGEWLMTSKSSAPAGSCKTCSCCVELGLRTDCSCGCF